MRVIYDGPIDMVRLHIPGTDGVDVCVGDSINLADYLPADQVHDFARRLLSQPIWREDSENVADVTSELIPDNGGK